MKRGALQTMTTQQRLQAAFPAIRVSVRQEGGKKVWGLHGFASDVEYAIRILEKRDPTKYLIERTPTGIYLYSARVW